MLFESSAVAKIRLFDLKLVAYCTLTGQCQYMYITLTQVLLVKYSKNSDNNFHHGPLRKILIDPEAPTTLPEDSCYEPLQKAVYNCAHLHLSYVKL